MSFNALIGCQLWLILIGKVLPNHLESGFDGVLGCVLFISCQYYLLLYLHCVHVRNIMDIRMGIELEYIYIYSHP